MLSHDAHNGYSTSVKSFVPIGIHSCLHPIDIEVEFRLIGQILDFPTWQSISIVVH